MGDIPLLQSSFFTLPSTLSEMEEAKFYYTSLPSGLVLVACTSTTPWKVPTGPEAYQKLKELCVIGNHMLKEVWEGNLALKIHALLDSMKVKWTSTDIVCIRNVKESSAPIILWIGVMLASLSGDDGIIVASKCRELLIEYNIIDVDVEIRKSVITCSAGPKLFMPTYYSDPTVDVHEPLTTTLGLPICAQSMPWAKGTGSFFITEGGNTKRLLLVTARHIVFTPDKNDNKHFKHKNNSQHRYNVMLFSNAVFNKYLGSIQAEIKGKAFMAQYKVRCIRAFEGKDDPVVNKECQSAQTRLDEVKEVMEELNTFYQDVLTHWATLESRILGHVILSPPISVGSSSKNYTEDWAIIKIDASKVNASNFNSNAIDLGTRIPVGELTYMMRPNPKNPHSFLYPVDCLLRLQSTIPDEEMHHPPILNLNDNLCLMVIKRGNTTGLTVGRANDICSYTHIYDNDDKAETSKEWAILSFDSKSGAFSDKGDLGSVIVDGLGHISGLLTSGAGTTASLDITYATPISFLLKRMQDNGLHKPNINLVLTA